ncbi:hypothetical protein BD779DRAFT_1475219 [Infundibulicybe gibba]|nr:hypothetical protein BD779DRAFT_1475219 [Infundibulicybe gibba]
MAASIVFGTIPPSHITLLTPLVDAADLGGALRWWLRLRSSSIYLIVNFPTPLSGIEHIPQGHRFNILEDVGCYPFTYNTPRRIRPRSPSSCSHRSRFDGLLCPEHCQARGRIYHWIRYLPFQWHRVNPNHEVNWSWCYPACLYPTRDCLQAQFPRFIVGHDGLLRRCGGALGVQKEKPFSPDD